MVLDFFAKALDFVFVPLTFFPAHVSILLAALIITSLIMLLNRLVINKKVVDEIKKRMEILRENITQAQKEENKENVQKYISEWASVNNTYMKHTFKTMIVSLVVVMIFYSWLGFRFSGFAVNIPFELPLVGARVEWPIWYVLASLAIGWVARKLFGG